MDFMAGNFCRGSGRSVLGRTMAIGYGQKSESGRQRQFDSNHGAALDRVRTGLPGGLAEFDGGALGSRLEIFYGLVVRAGICYGPLFWRASAQAHAERVSRGRR